MAMGMLPGDEIVADYLARAGRAAACVLPPAECAAVVEQISRQVRASVGPPPRRDAAATAERLAELGDPEHLVAATARTPPRPFPVRPADEDNATLDLGRVRVPAPTDRLDVRVADPGLRVRPIDPDESVRAESFAGLSRLGWELVALVVLGAGVFVFGLLAWLLGALLVSRSRFWAIRDKVRVLLGVPATALVVSVLWAWVRATQIQESNDSGARVAVARHSLADSLTLMPELIGVSAALYLGFALVRDHHAG